MNGYAVGRQNGWMSANDIRELENLDRIPAEAGGDLYLVNGNMLPLEKAGDAYANTKPNKEDKSDEEQKVLEMDESG
jgi:hypothetical protein